MNVKYGETEIQIVLYALKDFNYYVNACATEDEVYNQFGIEPWTIKAIITKAINKTETAIKENDILVRPPMAKALGKYCA